MRSITVSLLGFVIVAVAVMSVLMAVVPVDPVPLNIRWKPDVTAERRGELEREFQLIDGHATEGTTWAYRLTDPTTSRIRSIVQHPSVDDTEHINRARFRPDFAFDRQRRIGVYGVVAGVIAAIGLLVYQRKRVAAASKSGVAS